MTEFHEFWCLSISVGGYQEIWKKGPRDYIEILTRRAIILHLEYSRSHGKKAEAERGKRQGARPPSLGAHPDSEPNQDSVSWEISTDLKDKG